MDYIFLKSKPLHERVGSLVQRAHSGSIDDSPYSVNDEIRALKRSRVNPDHVLLVVSVGVTNKSSPTEFSHIGSINSIADIATELRDIAQEYAEQMSQKDAETLPEPVETFTVNDVLEVNVYRDPEDDRAFVRIDADENETRASDLNRAKARVNKYLENHQMTDINDDKSWVMLGEIKIPFNVDIPSNKELLDLQSTGPAEQRDFDIYSKLGLCHLYKNGACIAKVSFSGPQFISQYVQLSHPHDNERIFHDISHAVNHSFGISNTLSAKEAALHHITHRNQTVSDTMSEIVYDSGVDMYDLFAQIAEHNKLPLEQAELAFWDLYSGHVYGKDLTQYPEMVALYRDITQKTGQFIPAAKTLADLVLQRIQDFEDGVSPAQRAKLDQQMSQRKHTEPHPQAPDVHASPKFQR